MTTDVSEDRFLDGRVTLLQPRVGFRAGLDAVMLAAAVTAATGDTVCDVGAGVGTAGLCLAARVPGLDITCVEREALPAALCRGNFIRNGHARHVDVIEADILARPSPLKERRQHFGHVFTNPPYHDAGLGTPAPDPAKARATSVTREDFVRWLLFCRALLRPRGTLTVIMPPAQLARAMRTLAPDGHGLQVIPLWPEAGEPARRVILRLHLNARTPFALLPGLVLHEADGRPTQAASQVLRQGQALFT